jgi:hypothetical protein
MRPLQHVSVTTEAAQHRPKPQAKPVALAQPRDEMWRSRRVLSGSDWMDAWVQKPGKR